jgi:hypothetical protein
MLSGCGSGRLPDENLFLMLRGLTSFVFDYVAYGRALPPGDTTITG